MTRPVHPAVYSVNLIEPLAKVVREHAVGTELLDSFGGLGHRLAELAALAGLNPTAVEIEPGYFHLGETHPCVLEGDATALPWTVPIFGAAVTSPPYPNGCTDNFHARDASKRNTYVHRLRERMGPAYHLRPTNLAGTNARRSPAALAAFYRLQRAAFAEVRRVLLPGAPYVVNTKDTPHEAYTAATRRQLVELGFEIVDTVAVVAKGLNHGSNQATGKADAEDITVAIKR